MRRKKSKRVFNVSLFAVQPSLASSAIYRTKLVERHRRRQRL